MSRHAAVDDLGMITEADLYTAFDLPEGPAVEFLVWKANECGLTGALRVLDMGCGPGRLLPALRGLGWRMTGLEPHPPYFEAAARIAEVTPGIEVRCGSFSDIDDRGAFELIAAINGPFQYLLTPDDRRTAMELRHYTPPSSQTVPFRGGRLTRMMEHTVDFHEARFTHRDRFELVGHDATTRTWEATSIFTMVSFPELSSLARSAGFVDLRTYRSLASRRKETLDGPRIVLCARQPTP